MIATLSAPKVNRYDLVWDAYWSFSGEPELGGIYSNYVHIYAVGDYKFEVSFRVGDGRTLGVLFCEVNVTDQDNYVTKRHYAFGQFYTNKGAKLFAQFALHHFIETETWLVCPSFEAIEYLNGEPYTLTGDEIVSEKIGRAHV